MMHPELAVRCGFVRTRDTTRRNDLPPVDEDRANARFEEWLKPAARSVKGAGGDACAYNTACRGRDFGCSEADTLDLMLSEAWDFGCGWPPEKLAIKVRNAFRYGMNVPGCAAAERDFAPVVVPDLPAPPAKTEPHRRKLFWQMLRDIRVNHEYRALVKYLLDRYGLSVLFGDSNAGKTFVVVSLALHVALGWPWWGHRVAQGAVIYIAAEAGTSLRNRVAAFRQHHNVEDKDAPFFLVPCPVDLLDPTADTAPLIELVKDAEKQCGQPVVLIVIDTLSRALSGGDENSSEAMGGLIANVDRLRAETDAHVLLVHHSGKDRSKGARGHSMLRAAVDTELQVADGVLSVTKARDTARAAPKTFRLHVVNLGVDGDGDPITSCVAIPDAASSAAEDFAEDPNDHRVILRKVQAHLARGAITSARQLEAEHGGVGGIFGVNGRRLRVAVQQALADGTLRLVQRGRATCLALPDAQSSA